MTNTEIKKAWETMKKELKKESGITYGFSMTAKQLNNRTATYCVCNDSPYEEEIKREQKSMERIQSYDSWTAEEKANSCARSEENIAYYRAQLEAYGTKENKVIIELEQLLASKAFKKFASNFEQVITDTEHTNGCYYIRFTY